MALNPWDYAASTKSEHAEQVALFMWCNMAANFGLDAAEDPKSYSETGYALARWPFRGPNAIGELAWLYAIKNQGHGDAIRGMQSKAEGVKAGVSDMCLPVPRMASALRSGEWPGLEPFGLYAGAYGGVVCGLYLELKRTKSSGKRAGKESEAQEKWRDYFLSVGYAYALATGWIEAKNILMRYLR